MSQTPTNSLEQRHKRSTKALFIWTSGWLLSLALVAFGPKFLWHFSTSITLVAIAVNLFLGYRMIVVNKQHLEALDELQRQLHMNAMAISLGVSMVFGAVYGLLEPVRLLDSTPSPSNILFVMGLSYLISIVINSRKYQ
ncbi:hypothetical protein HMF8227_02082 [Saliniradius amylolyticus]|uniref:Uncharacterized protein n=1 Tax=Saliniradius amylolyticus TaxID=2183582 RepID=A0A2S2E4I5_9ALTE|nr:hypothetical protein [Saliniradius amylolyticus]AWL12543.1 hypothetical protein HMF8227_02082 [Saliniradius amylolyticus]